MKIEDIMTYSTIDKADSSKVDELKSLIHENSLEGQIIIVSELIGTVIYGVNLFTALRKIYLQEFDFDLESLAGIEIMDADDVINKYCEENNCTFLETDFERIIDEILQQ